VCVCVCVCVCVYVCVWLCVCVCVCVCLCVRVGGVRVYRCIDVGPAERAARLSHLSPVSVSSKIMKSSRISMIFTLGARLNGMIYAVCVYVCMCVCVCDLLMIQ
jgi:hypothetical protein